LASPDEIRDEHRLAGVYRYWLTVSAPLGGYALLSEPVEDLGLFPSCLDGS
jgi:hypothetical protein